MEKKCTYARMDELAEEAKASEADMIFGMGGGKALDTAKELRRKPDFRFLPFRRSRLPVRQRQLFQ